MTDLIVKKKIVSLVISLFNWIVSCPSSWKEFDLEFRTPENNIVSLFIEKIETFLDLGCEANLCSLNFSSSYEWVLYIGHVWKEYLGMKWLFGENPLRMWESLRDFWISSINFFIKDVKYLEWLGNEKDKEDEHLGGTTCISIWAYMIVFTAWGEVLWYNPIRQVDEKGHKRNFTIRSVISYYKTRPLQISEGPQ